MKILRMLSYLKKYERSNNMLIEGEKAPQFELKEVGAQKIEVIKAVRDVTAKGLKESKDLVDAAAAGTAQMIKEGVKKEEADEIAKKFTAAGAKVEIK